MDDEIQDSLRMEIYYLARELSQVVGGFSSATVQKDVDGAIEQLERLKEELLKLRKMVG